MRFLILVLALAVGLAACSGKSSSNSSDQSNAAASPAATASEMATSAATEAAGGGAVPSYPGAQTEASGTSNNAMGSATGTVMTTDDSFDKVYAWYQTHMPSDSEKTHTTQPVNSAVFVLGQPGQNQTSVTITTSGGKTMITVAKVNS